MTGRATIVSLVTVGVVLAMAVCSDLGPKKVPPPMREEARIEYRVQMVVDSARVRELEAENLRLARVAASMVGRAKKSDSIASEFRASADSISVAAYRAFKIEEKAQLWQESAQTYRLALDASTMAGKVKDSTLVVRDSQNMKKDEVISTEQARRARAESRVAELEPFALRADDCKIVRFINCPTRKQAFVAGAITAAVVVALVVQQLRPQSVAGQSTQRDSGSRREQSPTTVPRSEQPPTG